MVLWGTSSNDNRKIYYIDLFKNKFKIKTKLNVMSLKEVLFVPGTNDLIVRNSIESVIMVHLKNDPHEAMILEETIIFQESGNQIYSIKHRNDNTTDI